MGLVVSNKVFTIVGTDTIEASPQFLMSGLNSVYATVRINQINAGGSGTAPSNIQGQAQVSNDGMAWIDLTSFANIAWNAGFNVGSSGPVSSGNTPVGTQWARIRFKLTGGTGTAPLPHCEFTFDINTSSL